MTFCCVGSSALALTIRSGWRRCSPGPGTVGGPPACRGTAGGGDPPAHDAPPTISLPDPNPSLHRGPAPITETEIPKSASRARSVERHPCCGHRPGGTAPQDPPRHGRYARSLKYRKRVEEAFGWAKTDDGRRQPRPAAPVVGRPKGKRRPRPRQQPDNRPTTRPAGQRVRPTARTTPRHADCFSGRSNKDFGKFLT